MDSPFIIIAIVFGAGLLLMIPFGIMNSNRKKKEQQAIADSKGMAIVNVYGTSVEVDETPIEQMNAIRGQNLQHIVPVLPGRHAIAAKYTEQAGKRKIKTDKPVGVVFDLEADCEYTLGIYQYSPEQRHRYYDGDVGETIACVPLDIAGKPEQGGTTPAAYIIVYKEKCNGQPVLAPPLPENK